MTRNRTVRVLALAGILTSLAWIQAPAAKADAYIVTCCNSSNQCNYGYCNDGNTLWNYLRLRFSGECGTTVEVPGGSGGTCTYKNLD